MSLDFTVIVVFFGIFLQFLFDFEYSDHEEPDSVYKGACFKHNFAKGFVIIIFWRVLLRSKAQFFNTY